MVNNLKEESTTSRISAEIENLPKEEATLTPWKQIADKFRKCILNNSTIVEFLDSLLTLDPK